MNVNIWGHCTWVEHTSFHYSCFSIRFDSNFKIYCSHNLQYKFESVLEGRLPKCYQLFLFTWILGANSWGGVGWGLNGCFETCVPQIKRKRQGKLTTLFSKIDKNFKILFKLDENIERLDLGGRWLLSFLIETLVHMSVGNGTINNFFWITSAILQGLMNLKIIHDF